MTVRQWDVGIWRDEIADQGYAGHAVACPLCGGGNVTPMNSKVSKALADKWTTHPWDPGGRPDDVYKFQEYELGRLERK